MHKIMHMQVISLRLDEKMCDLYDFNIGMDVGVGWFEYFRPYGAPGNFTLV